MASRIKEFTVQSTRSRKKISMLKAILRVFLAIASLLGFIHALSVESSIAAEAGPAWQLDWEKTVRAAEEEGAVTIYMTGAFEPVFRDPFQKKFPKIKVISATGRGPELSQRVMSERRAEKFAVD